MPLICHMVVICVISLNILCVMCVISLICVMCVITLICVMCHATDLSYVVMCVISLICVMCVISLICVMCVMCGWHGGPYCAVHTMSHAECCVHAAWIT